MGMIAAEVSSLVMAVLVIRRTQAVLGPRQAFSLAEEQD
jgi:hypothetical protein